MEYHFSFSEQELDVIYKALVELPFKASAPVVSKINQQIAEQQKEEKKEAANGN